MLIIRKTVGNKPEFSFYCIQEVVILDCLSQSRENRSWSSFSKYQSISLHWPRPHWSKSSWQAGQSHSFFSQWPWKSSSESQDERTNTGHSSTFQAIHGHNDKTDHNCSSHTHLTQRCWTRTSLYMMKCKSSVSKFKWRTARSTPTPMNCPSSSSRSTDWPDIFLTNSKGNKCP